MLSNRSMPPGTIIPVLVYNDLDSAVGWLCRTFGFRERLRIGEHRPPLVFGDASVVVTADEGTPQHSASHSIMICATDVDSHYAHARTHGACLRSSPQTYPCGERQYGAEDPGGHPLSVTQTVTDSDPLNGMGVS